MDRVDIDLSFRPGEGLPLTQHERLRAQGPVFWSERLGGWVASSHATVQAVLSDFRRFSSEGTPIAAAFGAEAMLVTDSKLHNVMRAVWARSVSPAAMAAQGAKMRQIAVARLAPLAAGLGAGETVELMAPVQDFVVEIIALMFELQGGPVADLKRWHKMFGAAPALEMAPDDPRQATHRQAKAEVHAFLHEMMAARRARISRGETVDDLIGLMVAAEGKNGITRENATDNLLNFFLGALDTTTKWIGNAIVTLARQPEILRQLRAARELLAQILEEVMRCDTVAQVLQRIVREDGTELGGQLLAAGQTVFVLPGAANRDPLVFAEPDRFDVRRYDVRGAAKPHLGFGYGLHQCLGAATARAETQAFVDVFLDLCPSFAVAECRYGASWALWGPVAVQIRG